MKREIAVYGLIVLLPVLAMAMPVSAQVQMAEEFGVEYAMGNMNTYVVVPVNIKNTMNGPITDMGFYLLYNENVLNLTDERITKGDLTGDWFLMPSKEETGKYFVGITGVFGGTAIPDGSTGSVVKLNFSVVGDPGTSSPMNFSSIRMKNETEAAGFAPPKNGTFRVDAGAPIVINPSANPDTIMADGIQESQLNVTVRDDIAVRNVTLDLTSIGGDLVYMYNIGNYTEDDNLWCVFSYSTTAAVGTSPGTYYLQVNATDLLENYNNTVSIELNVTTPSNGSVIGQITYACNGTGIPEVTVNLTKESNIIYSTLTNNTGYYNFTNIDPGSYYVNASKPRFWDNSTNVTVPAGEKVRKDLILWLKGDLDNDGISASKDDLVLMFKAYLGFVEPDWRYDLNEDGELADKDDLVLMFKAYLGFIVLE